MRTLRDHVEADAADYALAASTRQDRLAKTTGGHAPLIDAETETWRQVSNRLRASLRQTQELDRLRDEVVEAARKTLRSFDAMLKHARAPDSLIALHKAVLALDKEDARDCTVPGKCAIHGKDD